MKLENHIANREYHDICAREYNAITYGTVRNPLNLARVSRILKDILFDGARVLEIGTGTGFIPEVLEEIDADCSYIGVDISHEMLKLSKVSKPNWHYMLADAYALPIASNSVDIVIIYATLHHIADIRALLSELKRVLTDKGLVYIGGEYNASSLQSKLLKFYWDIKFKYVIWRSRGDEKLKRKLMLERESEYHLYRNGGIVTPNLIEIAKSLDYRKPGITFHNFILFTQVASKIPGLLKILNYVPHRVIASKYPNRLAWNFDAIIKL